MKRLVTYHVTDEVDAIGIADGTNPDGSAETVAVLSESDEEGLTPGQVAFKHNVPKGTGQGEFSE